MSTIYIEPAQKAREVLYLVQSAIESERTRLELALKLARERLIPFEQKYSVSSACFQHPLKSYQKVPQKSGFS